MATLTDCVKSLLVEFIEVVKLSKVQNIRASLEVRDCSFIVCACIIKEQAMSYSFLYLIKLVI